MIIRVSVALRRTVYDHDKLKGSHHQSQVNGESTVDGIVSGY